MFNIGSTEEISIIQLAERIREATQSESEIVLVPYSEAYGEGFEDMPRRVPDLTRIQSTLGWAPTLSLDEIIADVIKHQMTREPAPGAAISQADAIPGNGGRVSSEHRLA